MGALKAVMDTSVPHIPHGGADRCSGSPNSQPPNDGVLGET